MMHTSIYIKMIYMYMCLAYRRIFRRINKLLTELVFREFFFGGNFNSFCNNTWISFMEYLFIYYLFSWQYIKLKQLSKKTQKTGRCIHYLWMSELWTNFMFFFILSLIFHISTISRHYFIAKNKNSFNFSRKEYLVFLLHCLIY